MNDRTPLSDSTTEVGSIIEEPTTSMCRLLLKDWDAKRLCSKATAIVEDLYITPIDKLQEKKLHHLTWLINIGVQEELAEHTVEICSRAIRAHNLEHALVPLFMWLLGFVFPIDCRLIYVQKLKRVINKTTNFQKIPPKSFVHGPAKEASINEANENVKETVKETATETVKGTVNETANEVEKEAPIYEADKNPKENVNKIATIISNQLTKIPGGHVTFTIKIPPHESSNSSHEQDNHSGNNEIRVQIPSLPQHESHSSINVPGQLKTESDQLGHPSGTEAASENSAATNAGNGTRSNQDASHKNLCFQCQRPASKICPACVLDGDESSKVWYCSIVCQKEHRATHKSDCNFKCDQKAVTRITTILQIAWNQFNDNTCTDRLHRIFRKNGMLFFDASQDERHALVGDFIFQTPLVGFYANEDDKRIHQNFHSAMGIQEWFSKLILKLLERK
jgi:hypothetical protein